MSKLITYCVLTSILALSIFSMAEGAKPYKIKWQINFADKESLQCTDEIYVRDTNAEPDKNGEHKILLAKQTINNPTQTSYTIVKAFDPKRAAMFDSLMRDYLLLEQNELVIYKNYKHPYTHFDPVRHQYTFTYNIPHLECGQDDNTAGLKAMKPLRVSPGDKNRV